MGSVILGFHFCVKDDEAELQVSDNLTEASQKVVNDPEIIVIQTR